MTFVTELAEGIRCDRVSFGVVRRGHVTVRAVSHTAQFEKRMNLNRLIALAMEEAVVQRSEIRYPSSSSTEVRVMRDHEQFAKQHGIESILTFPLYVNGRYYGAVTLERSVEHPFSDDDIEFCRSVSSLAGPILEAKQLHDRALPLKIVDSCQKQLNMLFGGGYAGRKLLAFLFLSIIVFFSFAKGEYRLAATASLEGAVQRVLVAPFNSYIRDAQVRAGDIVETGMVMCSFDDRDMRMERLRWLSQQTQLQRQLQQAIALHDRVQINILNARLDQVQANLELVETQLERIIIRAPFNGLVISGDLSQRLGGPVEQGEVLFQVTPLDEYRVVLQVNENRIADVRIGQRGGLVLSALPNLSFNFIIKRITPISEASEGRNYFRAEAQLDSISDYLRPGMEGIGKISIDRRKLISIWTRDIILWLRIKMWSWLP
ncbi:HlyD family efflux transporter periplasmic adaptor subunit [Candidatus Latescibacterota bacterium]